MLNISNDNFVFKGFQPSSELKLYGKEVYSRVEGKAPSESKKVAFISKTNEGYMGSFRIASASGIFKANSRHIQPKPLIDELYRKMSSQILDWNKNRAIQFQDK